MSDHAPPRVLVTGGASGLGLAMARTFHRTGCAVTVCARTQSDLDAAAAELPGLRAVRADITDDDDRATLMGLFDDDGLDILVNNAAISRAHDYTSPYTLGTDRARTEIEVNLAAPIDLTRRFLHGRSRVGFDRSATVAFISTPGALFPLEANPLYSATKAGLHTFTASLRYQLRSTAVRVVEVFPPALATGLTPDLDVGNQAANGAEVVAAVGQRSAEGILAGEETVLPHPDAEQLHRRFAADWDDELLTAINGRVRRAPDWDSSPD